MSRIINVLSIPLVASFSLPLFFFAVFTTTVALTTLFIRVSVVYVELALALLQSALGTSTATHDGPFRPHSPEAEELTRIKVHPRSRRASTQTGASSASSSPLQIAVGASAPAATPHSGASHAQWSVPATTPRDYEGVGGWRVPVDDEDEEALWTGINSRLELPALSIPSPTVMMNRPRALSGGLKRQSSALPSRPGSPQIGRSPGRDRRGRRNRKSGSASPEGYFGSISGFGLPSNASSANTMELLASPAPREGSARAEELHKIPTRNSSVSLVKVSGDG